MMAANWSMEEVVAVYPPQDNIYDSIFKDIEKATRIFRALVPEELAILFFDNPELYVTMNDFVEKMKTQMIKRKYPLPLEFDFCDIVSAISTVYFYFMRHPQYQSFGTFILPDFNPVRILKIPEQFSVIHSNRGSVPSLTHLVAEAKERVDLFLRHVPLSDATMNHLAIFFSSNMSQPFIVFIDVDDMFCESFVDTLKNTPDMALKNYSSNVIDFSFSGLGLDALVYRKIFNSVDEALIHLKKNDLLGFAFHKNKFHCNILSLFEMLVGKRIEYGSQPNLALCAHTLSFSMFDVIRVRKSKPFLRKPTHVVRPMGKSINFLLIANFLARKEDFAFTCTNEKLNFDRSESNIDENIRKMLECAHTIVWQIAGPVMFGDKAQEFVKILFDILQKRPVSSDDTFPIADYPELFEFVKPFCVKQLATFDELCHKLIDKPFKRFNPKRKPVISKCDEEVKGLINIGIPWEKLRLLWILHLKPEEHNTVKIPQKDVITLIERAYVFNELEYVKRCFESHTLNGDIMEHLTELPDMRMMPPVVAYPVGHQDWDVYQPQIGEILPTPYMTNTVMGEW